MIKKARKHPDLSAVCFQVPSRNPNSRCSRFTPRRAAWLWSRANAPGASTGSRGIVFRATHVEPWTPPRDNTVSSSVWAREISSAGEYESNGYFSVCRVANPIQRGGRERGGGEGARFPPTWFLFPLGRGRARYPPEEKRSWGRGGWTHSRFDANRHNLSLSLLLLSFSSSPRIEGCTLRCVFQLLGSSNLRGGGRGRLHHAPTESRVFLGHEAADVSCEGREGREREIVEGPARDFDRPLGYLRDFSPARYVILFKIFSPFLFSPPPPRVEFDRVFFTSLVPRSTFRRH